MQYSICITKTNGDVQSFTQTCTDGARWASEMFCTAMNDSNISSIVVSRIESADFKAGRKAGIEAAKAAVNKLECGPSYFNTQIEHAAAQVIFDDVRKALAAL